MIHSDLSVITLLACHNITYSVANYYYSIECTLVVLIEIDCLEITLATECEACSEQNIQSSLEHNGMFFDDVASSCTGRSQCHCH